MLEKSEVQADNLLEFDVVVPAKRRGRESLLGATDSEWGGQADTFWGFRVHVCGEHARADVALRFHCDGGKG